MRQHLLCVTHPVIEFSTLIAALRQDGQRVGWLALEPPSSLPSQLEEAAGQGVLRAVAVGGGRSIAVKPMRGRPVLRDLLREHFRGCQLVLVHHGEADDAAGNELAAAPRLAPAGNGWNLVAPGAPGRRLTTARLVALLRKPYPFAAEP